jgi:uncharacterized membrane protein YfcA
VHFGVSGVDVAPWVPVLAGLCAAAVTTPAGLSGAFVLLPFQTNVLGFTAPAVSATNLVFNVVATPGGLLRYGRQRLLGAGLVGPLLAGTLPGVSAGALLRVVYLHEPAVFKALVGVVLVYLAAQILLRMRRQPRRPEPAEGGAPRPWLLAALGAGSGVVGGILGVGGGAIIAPVLVTVARQPVRLVSAAALAVTFATSATGLGMYQLLDALDIGRTRPVAPDWLLGALFGLGGLIGSYLGARLQRRLPDRWLTVLLTGLVAVLAATYVAALT